MHTASLRSGWPAAVACAAMAIGAPVSVRAQDERDNGLPGIRIGWLEMDPRVRAQVDWREADRVRLQRAHVGVAGTLLKRIEFEIDRELTDDRAWRDVYVDVALYRPLQIKAGRFKIPFSLDRLTSATDLDFVHRTLAAEDIAPGRNLGVMAHGPIPSKRLRLKYHGGVFGHDDERGTVREVRTAAGRVSMQPVEGLTAGVSFTASRVPAGLNSLRGRTVWGDVFFPRVYVEGLRRRGEADLEWRIGPVSARSEVTLAIDERQRQGLDDEDLPDLRARAWYVSGTWLVTGERKTDEIRPHRPLPGHGIGAVEVAARLEEFRLNSRNSGLPPAPGERAATILEAGDRVWTLGVNWYLSRFVLLQANAIHERRQIGGAPLPGLRRAWGSVVRLQVEL
jgi:phosphate-selective porin OprO/OprP